jgi:hypothetical protein
MAKPDSTRHLYEIHTAPQPPLVTEVLSAEHVIELARLRDFLWSSMIHGIRAPRQRVSRRTVTAFDQAQEPAYPIDVPRPGSGSVWKVTLKDFAWLAG